MATCTRTKDAAKKSGALLRRHDTRRRFESSGEQGGGAWPAAEPKPERYSIRASSRALTIASSLEWTPSLLPRLLMCVRTVV